MLSQEDVALLTTALDLSQTSAQNLEMIYGPQVVYNREVLQRWNVEVLAPLLEQSFTVDPLVVAVKELCAVCPSSSAQNVNTTWVVAEIFSNAVDFATQDYPSILQGAMLLHFIY